MTPPRAGHADDHELPIFIAFLAEWALLKTVARATSGVAVKPRGIDAWLVFPTILTQGAPFTLPRTIWYMVQRWFGTVDVVRDVTVVAKDRVCLVMFATTSLTDRTVEAPPTFLQDHLGHLHIDTVRVVALAALGAADEPTLQIVAKRATHHTYVLHVGEVVLV